MKKENEQRLYREFPELYRDVNRPHSLMSWGMSCGNGWFPLVYELSQKIAEVASEYGLNGDLYPRVAQVKEKFGSLRFYIRIGGEDGLENAGEHVKEASSKIQALVNEAGSQSMHTCEECGNQGKLIRDGWWRVRCDRCEAERAVSEF